MSKNKKRIFEPTNASDSDEEYISSSLLKKEELHVLVFIRKLLLDKRQDQENEERAKSIEEIKSEDYLIDIKSDLSFVMRSLGNKKLSMKDLIQKMKSIGWDTPSKNPFSVVQDLLDTNFYMFKRNKKGLFSIRKGFCGPSDLNTLKSCSIVKPVFTKPATLTDIIFNILRKSPNGLSYGGLSKVLEHVGVDASFRSINSILHNNRSFQLKNNMFFIKGGQGA
jgi:hypothetical protein